MNKIGNIKNKNILFLQGPIGPFFKKLDLIFRKRGARTFKVTLNAADYFFSNKDNTYPFKGEQKEWKTFIKDFFLEHKIDKILLFGDCRFYQSYAITIAKKLNIDVYVFEEGYVRPDFVTMELYGVNNFSKISRDSQFYTSLDNSYLKDNSVLPAYPKYSRMAYAAISYYLISNIFSFRYPHYIHHRETNAIKEFFWQWRNIFRKAKYHFSENSLEKNLTRDLSKKYYFVPLQTYNDFQLKEHSHFDTIENFISQVLHSYAKYAPKDTLLVIKHHPQDRGRKDYSLFISVLSTKLHISDRVISAFDVHLPTCLKNAKATITINSTVGLSSLFHKTPTLALGEAIYNIEGLTSTNTCLDDFWNHHEIPDSILFQKFRNYIIETTQLNGSFYGRFPIELMDDDMYQH